MGVCEFEKHVDSIVESHRLLPGHGIGGGGRGGSGFTLLFDARKRHRSRQSFDGCRQIVVQFLAFGLECSKPDSGSFVICK